LQQEATRKTAAHSLYRVGSWIPDESPQPGGLTIETMAREFSFSLFLEVAAGGLFLMLLLMEAPRNLPRNKRVPQK
jgi:hypothetical protein